MIETNAADGGFRALADAQRRLGQPRRAALAEGAIEYVTAGDGEPPIALVSGYGVPLSSWALAIEQLRAIGTVLAYNRPGVGGSATPQRPQTGAAVVDVLRRTLGAAGLRPPYVVVAHALSGLHAQLYARLHADELAGLVLLEAAHPDDDPLERRLRFLPRAVVRATTQVTTGRSARRHGELSHVGDTVAEIRRAGPFPDLPLVVVTGAKTPSRLAATPAQIELRATRQRQLAALSPRGEQLFAPRSGYIPQITDPGTVAQAVRRVIQMGDAAHADDRG